MATATAAPSFPNGASATPPPAVPTPAKTATAVTAESFTQQFQHQKQPQADTFARQSPQQQHQMFSKVEKTSAGDEQCNVEGQLSAGGAVKGRATCIAEKTEADASAGLAAGGAEGEADIDKLRDTEAAVAEDEELGPSRLKFPSYDDFLAEEEEAERNEAASLAAAAEEGARAAAPGGAELDAAFELFMNEVKDDGKSNEGRKAASGLAKKDKSMKFKSPSEECIRLTAQHFPSPFQIFLLGAEATDEDIRKQYRKLSLLIHPDKCKHPSAHEAFQIVNKAYEQLQRPEMRERYRDVIEEAKRRVIRQRVRENKKRMTQSITVPLLSEDPADLQKEIMEMCEKMLEETKDRREYAERTRQANERYEKEQQERLEKEELDKCRERKEFIDKREERVGAWREYQQAVREKDFKLQAFTGVRHQREQRKEGDVVKKRQKVQGLDTSYKECWR